MDSQPLDPCLELAMPPGKEGQQNAQLCSFLFFGILASLVLVAVSALIPLNRQLKKYVFGILRTFLMGELICHQLLYQ